MNTLTVKAQKTPKKENNQLGTSEIEFLPAVLPSDRPNAVVQKLLLGYQARQVTLKHSD